ncbi:Uncharacterised protein [Sebaldella termitidis]|jgi:hypothetical protein|uniref:Uncharacterized protein n=1 Tax=Sebaldella termitidis (strain ATCC 33386 / NCTC 11300) TaxID=526218 RepID=D1AK89_SEBTE|nr:hypothetical protein [Sebaldella termitidis]ACZ09005.1 hypothetical protein Sterm_2151 [Sebaldella termitidis ATCC 33386]SUI24324.1 Uncharacterised protein [Sebaldella termitidis]
MYKLRTLFILIFALTISILTFSKSKPETSSDNFYELKKINQIVIKLIKKRDISALSKYAHPKKGIMFSPYSDLKNNDNQIIEKKELVKIYEKNEELVWGEYDGTGVRILLTFDNYFDRFIYDEDFIEYEPNYDSIMGTGNSIENMNSVFPYARSVEYYTPGTEEYAYMDWKSLRLLYEIYRGKYYLVAVVHNEWTI